MRTQSVGLNCMRTVKGRNSREMDVKPLRIEIERVLFTLHLLEFRY